jgi:RNA polymerase sigma factor (sigma-70 family)
MANREPDNEDHYLELATHGDREGLEYLVGAYRSLAYTIAIKILGNKEDAEEVVQEAFLKAFAALANFNRAAKFSTWLYRIVYNTALTEKSSRPASSSTLDELTEDISVTDNKDGLATLHRADRKKYVDLALSRLRQEDRLIVTLHYIAEKSIAETGEIMGLKPSAVKMRLLRARKQLETGLEKLLTNELNEIR